MPPTSNNKAATAADDPRREAALKLQTLVQRDTVTVAGGDERGYWDFFCECGFLSQGWPKKALAEARGAQHVEEHATGEPAPMHTDLLQGSQDQKAAFDIAQALRDARRARGVV